MKKYLVPIFVCVLVCAGCSFSFVGDNKEKGQKVVLITEAFDPERAKETELNGKEKQIALKLLKTIELRKINNVGETDMLLAISPPSDFSLLQVLVEGEQTDFLFFSKLGKNPQYNLTKEEIVWLKKMVQKNRRYPSDR